MKWKITIGQAVHFDVAVRRPTLSPSDQDSFGWLLTDISWITHHPVGKAADKWEEHSEGRNVSGECSMTILATDFFTTIFQFILCWAKRNSDDFGEAEQKAGLSFICHILKKAQSGNNDGRCGNSSSTSYWTPATKEAQFANHTLIRRIIWSSGDDAAGAQWYNITLTGLQLENSEDIKWSWNMSRSIMLRWLRWRMNFGVRVIGWFEASSLVCVYLGHSKKNLRQPWDIILHRFCVERPANLWAEAVRWELTIPEMDRNFALVIQPLTL